MAVCIHGDVCRAWMNERTILNKYPLSQECPYGCTYFEELGNNKDYVNRVNYVSTLDEVRLMRQKAINHIRESINAWHITTDELEEMMDSENEKLSDEI